MEERKYSKIVIIGLLGTVLILAIVFSFSYRSSTLSGASIFENYNCSTGFVCIPGDHDEGCPLGFNCEEECEDDDGDDGDDGCDCDGKVTWLTMRYDGSGNSVIRVEQKKGGIVYEDNVSSGDNFTFYGTYNGALSTEISMYIDNVLNVKIHTSCSQPIEIGMVKGDFTIINGASKNGGPFCDGNSGDDDCEDDDGDDCDSEITCEPKECDLPGNQEGICVGLNCAADNVCNQLCASGDDLDCTLPCNISAGYSCVPVNQSGQCAFISENATCGVLEICCRITQI